MKGTKPSFDEVAAFVSDFAGIPRSSSIEPETRLEQDLGITGDDGDALLKEASKRFSVDLASREAGYRASFGLAPNEYLFSSEGVDLLGITVLLRLLSGEPKPIVLDLTVGRLHEVICRMSVANDAT